MNEKNARRFFLDLDEDGKVLMSAPPRTSFDDRLPILRGDSSTEEGFTEIIPFAGRMFRVEITSWKNEPLKGLQ